MRETCMKYIEANWKRHTVLSNELFRKKEFGQALSGYKEALYRAEVMNEHISDCLRLKIPFIQVYIISCNNLANTYEASGHIEEAEGMFKRVVYYLLHLAGNKDLNIDEIQSELKRATINYMRFVEKVNDGNAKQKQLLRVLKDEVFGKQSN